MVWNGLTRGVNYYATKDHIIRLTSLQYRFQDNPE